MLETLIGKTPIRVKQDDTTLIFWFNDETVATFYHEQDCCEVVTIEDVNGDWEDLLHRPLLSAKKTTQHGMADSYDSFTWTFYTFRSIKGSVDVRWYGTSNGYYSEEVSLFIEKIPA